MKVLVFVCALAVTTPVVALTATQLAGRIDAPAAAPPLQDALVGEWRGSLYKADVRTDFTRVDVALRFSASGVVRIERGPYPGRPLQDIVPANYLVFGDNVALSMHGSGYPVELVGVRITGDTLEFAIPKEVATGGLVEGGYRLTRQ